MTEPRPFHGGQCACDDCMSHDIDAAYRRAAPSCDRCEDRAPNVCVCVWNCHRHEGCAGKDGCAACGTWWSTNEDVLTCPTCGATQPAEGASTPDLFPFVSGEGVTSFSDLSRPAPSPHPLVTDHQLGVGDEL